MSIKCPSCYKRYKYSQYFEKHLEEKHPLIAPAFIAYQTAECSHSTPESSEDIDEDFYCNGDDDFDFPSTEDINKHSDSDQEPESDFNISDKGPDIQGTTTTYDGAVSSHGSFASYEERLTSLRLDPWPPFKSAEEFKLARWFIRAKTSQSAIDDYF